jgi:hypothetical protein
MAIVMGPALWSEGNEKLRESCCRRAKGSASSRLQLRATVKAWAALAGASALMAATARSSSGVVSGTGGRRREEEGGEVGLLLW